MVVGVLLFSPAVGVCAEPVTMFGYILNASINAEVAPSYEGGKHYAAFPGGSVAATKPWEFDAFVAPDDAAAFTLINLQRFEFGAAASVRENRGNDDELQGMRNIGWSLQGGGYMNVWPTRYLRIHVEGLKGVTAQTGLVVNTGMDLVAHPTMWNLSAGPRYSWGDRRFNGTYFGVTDGEAAASPYIAHAFNPGAGSHYAGVEAMAEYKWRPNWRLTLNVGYNRMLAGDAASPLVRQIGTVDQYSVGAGLRFAL
jgi:outer membrane scaffolding protein for murein synthesis (MipA/OmpV family)